MKKIKASDGMGAHEISKIRSALRQVWQRSLARRLVVKRCERKKDKDIFYECEECEREVPQIKIDHIVQVGDLDEGFLQRLFCPSAGLQGLCKKCHDEKTKAERAEKKKRA